MTSPEEFPMIDVMKMNETEVRLFALLFHFVRYPQGLSFQRLRNIMPRYYKNEDIESDRKKLYRDLTQLKALGFNIKMAQFGYQSEDHYPYFLEKDTIDKTLNFTAEELQTLSQFFFLEVNSNDLQSLGQKLFSRDLNLFPKNLSSIEFKNKENEESGNLEKIIQALKDRRALSIQYGFSTEERMIEPYRLIRKNAIDFYLLAYDRSKKGIRRFILPRIHVKRETKEDFFSNIKLTESDLNFHPLNLKVHSEKTFKFRIFDSFSERWQQFLMGFPYSMEEDTYCITTTNQNAIFHFFVQIPDALEFQDPIFEKEFSDYIISWQKLYELV